MAKKARGPRTAVGIALEARAQRLGLGRRGALALAAGVSERLIQDLVTGARTRFNSGSCTALDLALGLPQGTVETSIQHRTGSMIERAPYPQARNEWLAAVLLSGGCTAGAKTLQRAAQRLLRDGDPQVREAALAVLAIARELPPPGWRSEFGRRLAVQRGLTAGDRLAFGEAADLLANRAEPGENGSAAVSGPA